MLPCQPFRYFLVPRFQLGRLADDTNYHMTDILVVTETIQLILCEKKTNSANWLILFSECIAAKATYLSISYLAQYRQSMYV